MPVASDTGDCLFTALEIENTDSSPSRTSKRLADARGFRRSVAAPHCERR
jgi:hypothetical protein